MTREMTYSTLAAAILAMLGRGVFIGPAWAQDDNEKAFDYAPYTEALKTHTDDNGMVYYGGLKAHPAKLLAYVNAIGTLSQSRYDNWDDKAKIAFWLNAYNGLTLKAIIDNYPIKASFLRSRIYPKNSIRQIPGVWDELKFAVMGQKITLEHIEHKILRIRFNEPRIHMALVCAAMGCPPLRPEPYIGDQLDQQLDDQTRRFLGHREKFRIDRSKDVVHLSPIFKWFAEDFVRKYAPARNLGRHDDKTSAVLNFLAGYLDEKDEQYIRTGDFKVKYLDYDWTLNERQVRR